MGGVRGGKHSVRNGRAEQKIQRLRLKIFDRTTGLPGRRKWITK